MERYSGFLEHFVTKIGTKEPIVEMTSVMEKIEQTAAIARERPKTAMLCLYWVYNCCLAKELRRPNWEAFLKGYEQLLDKCCIETAAARLALGGELEWFLEECRQCFDEYDQKRFGNSITHIPLVLKTGIMATIANKALAEGKKDLHKAYLERAILNCPGFSGVQSLFAEAIANATRVKCEELVFGKAQETPTTPEKMG